MTAKVFLFYLAVHARLSCCSMSLEGECDTMRQCVNSYYKLQKRELLFCCIAKRCGCTWAWRLLAARSNDSVLFTSDCQSCMEASFLQRCKPQQNQTYAALLQQRWCLGNTIGGLFVVCSRTAARAYALVNLVTALVPSDTACLASSPGRIRRTDVWISRLVTVGFLL